MYIFAESHLYALGNSTGSDDDGACLDGGKYPWANTYLGYWCVHAMTAGVAVTDATQHPEKHSNRVAILRHGLHRILDVRADPVCPQNE